MAGVKRKASESSSPASQPPAAKRGPGRPKGPELNEEQQEEKKKQTLAKNRGSSQKVRDRKTMCEEIVELLAEVGDDLDRLRELRELAVVALSSKKRKKPQTPHQPGSQDNGANPASAPTGLQFNNHAGMNSRAAEAYRVQPATAHQVQGTMPPPTQPYLGMAAGQNSTMVFDGFAPFNADQPTWAQQPAAFTSNPVNVARDFDPNGALSTPNVGFNAPNASEFTFASRSEATKMPLTEVTPQNIGDFDLTGWSEDDLVALYDDFDSQGYSLRANMVLLNKPVANAPAEVPFTSVDQDFSAPAQQPEASTGYFDSLLAPVAQWNAEHPATVPDEASQPVSQGSSASAPQVEVNKSPQDELNLPGLTLPEESTLPEDFTLPEDMWQSFPDDNQTAQMYGNIWEQ